MIPIRDVIPSRTKPYVTFCLIGVNALVFLSQIALGADESQPFVQRFALIPAQLSAQTAYTLLTATFLHASWNHVIGNLVFLWIFGDNVEDRFGHRRFFAFYLIAGVAANLAQVAFDPAAVLPVLGASGAIAAVMGAYFVMFPKSRVVMLIWLVFYVDFVEIPAVLFLGFWFVFQFLEGLRQSAALDTGGIAIAAHIGGFAVGALSGRFLSRPERAEVSWWDAAT